MNLIESLFLENQRLSLLLESQRLFEFKTKRKNKPLDKAFKDVSGIISRRIVYNKVSATKIRIKLSAVTPKIETSPDTGAPEMTPDSESPPTPEETSEFPIQQNVSILTKIIFDLLSRFIGKFVGDFELGITELSRVNDTSYNGIDEGTAYVNTVDPRKPNIKIQYKVE